MADTAVIVIDMQRGLVQRARPAYRLDDVVAGINRLTAAARAANAPVCFVQHDGDADDDIVPGTPGWELHDALSVGPADWRIRKQMSDAFHDTPLAARRCSATGRASCRTCIRPTSARICRPRRSSRTISSCGKTARCRATR